MPISLDTIRAFISAVPEVRVDDSTQDLFFFRGEEQNFPFATIVTHDQPYDDQSKLDRPGVFRLNIQTDKTSFETLFPGFDKSQSPAAAGFDVTAADTLFPHPVYGNMRWVSVITPDETWALCRDLIEKAHAL